MGGACSSHFCCSSYSKYKPHEMDGSMEVDNTVSLRIVATSSDENERSKISKGEGNLSNKTQHEHGQKEKTSRSSVSRTSHKNSVSEEDRSLDMKTLGETLPEVESENAHKSYNSGETEKVSDHLNQDKGCNREDLPKMDETRILIPDQNEVETSISAEGAAQTICDVPGEDESANRHKSSLTCNTEKSSYHSNQDLAETNVAGSTNARKMSSTRLTPNFDIQRRHSEIYTKRTAHSADFQEKDLSKKIKKEEPLENPDVPRKAHSEDLGKARKLDLPPLPLPPKEEEPLKILDVHQYFKDDLDLNSLDSCEPAEKIEKIESYAKTFEKNVEEFDEEKYSLPYFVLDEKLMRLIEKLDRIKCQEDKALTERKVEVIQYIKKLHSILDERAKEDI